MVRSTRLWPALLRSVRYANACLCCSRSSKSECGGRCECANWAIVLNQSWLTQSSGSCRGRSSGRGILEQVLVLTKCNEQTSWLRAGERQIRPCTHLAAAARASFIEDRKRFAREGCLAEAAEKESVDL